MTGDRPRCPRHHERGRALYSRPEGTFQRIDGLYQCPSKGCLFVAAQGSPGTWRCHILANPGVVHDFLERVR